LSLVKWHIVPAQPEGAPGGAFFESSHAAKIFLQRGHLAELGIVSAKGRNETAVLGIIHVWCGYGELTP
jgi:hypothetical protein